MNHSHPLPVLPFQAHLRALPSDLPSVFDYDDYHEFLRDWVAARRAQWSAYSLQLLANRSKIKSRSFLRLVCLGQRGLGPQVAVEVARAMGMEPDAQERFLELVDAQRMVRGYRCAETPSWPTKRLQVGVGPKRSGSPGGRSAEDLSCHGHHASLGAGPGTFHPDPKLETRLARRGVTAPQARLAGPISA
ncbi:MAG TPA: hypothetical protein PKO15_08535 [Fibrobacteria bacterium]|nr:hypothetical protein [Fibrobacteria bacterium]HOX50278.1 hypothetical protein [Fibrobacteria bacterium]